MANTISAINAPGDAAGVAAAVPVKPAVQANLANAQSAEIEALFGSLGLGSKVNSTG